MSEQPKQTPGIAITSLVFSCLFLFPFLGPLFAITGIILGIIALTKISKNKEQLGGKGLAIAGVAVGASGIILIILITVLVLVFSPEFSRFREREQKQRSIAQEVAALSYSYPVLELKLVEDDMGKNEEALAGKTLEGYELKEAGDQKLLIEENAVLILDDFLKNAEQNISPLGQPDIIITLDKEGASLFAQLTEKNIGRRLAIVCNGNIVSAPVIREAISGGRMTITGTFSQEEVMRLVGLLKFAAKNRK